MMTYLMLRELIHQLDVKTILALGTALVSICLFLWRYREEARKTRIARLSTKSLDELFRFREQLVSCLDRFEDMPDIVDSEIAQQFWGQLRSIRRDIRNSIDQYALFGTTEEYERHSKAFNESDPYYRKIAQDLACHKISYKDANNFKRCLYLLLEDAGVRILTIQELDGRSRAPEVATLRAKYQTLHNEIDELSSRPDQWVPVTSSQP
jgi:hypothetical protein